MSMKPAGNELAPKDRVLFQDLGESVQLPGICMNEFLNISGQQSFANKSEKYT